MTGDSSYKFVYLGHYVINVPMVVALLAMHWLNWDLPELKGWLQMGICCMGVMMVLSLFGWSAFIVNDAYKGKGTLDTRRTRALTLLLALTEAMTLYYSAFGHEMFIKPASVCMVLWLVAFARCVFSGKYITRMDSVAEI